MVGHSRPYIGQQGPCRAGPSGLLGALLVHLVLHALTLLTMCSVLWLVVYW